MKQPQWMFVDPETGEQYRALLIPREHPGRLGVDPRLNALAFETPQGRWVGSVPIYHTVGFERITERDLAALLDQAVARG